jgi:hypothetical protein
MKREIEEARRGAAQGPVVIRVYDEAGNVIETHGHDANSKIRSALVAVPKRFCFINAEWFGTNLVRCLCRR